MGAVTVVFDTNVLVSALGFGGTPLRALFRTFEDDVTLAASAATLEELARVMRYERLPFTDADRAEFLAILDREATVVEPTEPVSVIDRDPADNAFLACAIAAEADYLVTGDDHLLALETFDELDILTPAVFLEKMS